jgi:hypothetical protein
MTQCIGHPPHSERSEHCLLDPTAGLGASLSNNLHVIQQQQQYQHQHYGADRSMEPMSPTTSDLEPRPATAVMSPTHRGRE